MTERPITKIFFSLCQNTKWWVHRNHNVLQVLGLAAHMSNRIASTIQFKQNSKTFLPARQNSKNAAKTIKFKWSRNESASEPPPPLHVNHQSFHLFVSPSIHSWVSRIKFSRKRKKFQHNGEKILQSAGKIGRKLRCVNFAIFSWHFHHSFWQRNKWEHGGWIQEELCGNASCLHASWWFCFRPLPSQVNLPSA